jgi:hypothetical protein
MHAELTKSRDLIGGLRERNLLFQAVSFVLMQDESVHEMLPGNTVVWILENRAQEEVLDRPTSIHVTLL